MAKSSQKMPLPEIPDDLFSTQQQRDEVNQKKIVNIPIKDIVPFPNHPFKVTDNDEIFEMAKSIEQLGVVTPAVVREKNGQYEMISGHRRKRASEIAELTTLPCVIENLTDDEAIVIMVDSNLQREKILPSERAFAFKMKLEALKHQGKRTDLTSATSVHKFSTRDEVGKEHGISGETVRKYIRLTELIPELLELVDMEKNGIALTPAIELSYLKKEEQKILYDAIEYSDSTPSHAQSIRLRELSEKNKLDSDMIDSIMEEEKSNQIPKIRINRDKLQKLLPRNLLNDKDVENYVVKCVEYYSRREKQRDTSR